ncbi:hypothetical protein K505DRAFT_106686 [Melanomma pulvis-pyrius CBS 109.77]|uniref:Uncharacterized protein n=1 Tax=Melanomma pulvis-pyrius CBS 109.77 TaxID=1314802 RepID=A0A6A6XS58_9PLEO|nr:hypothetical protein K505DRAFT_106686 [Melanomma pulvis-pyrius CBS 109.77]
MTCTISHRGRQSFSTATNLRPMSTTASPNVSRIQTTASSIPTTSYSACTWLGHCLGASCTTNDDCDQDWICVSKVCSPCCDDSGGPSSSVSVNPLPTATTTTTTTVKPHRLDTSAAIGIGVAIVVFVILGAGLGFWTWRIRRGAQRHVWEAPGNNEQSGPQADTTDSGTFADDQNRLVGIVSREELPCPIKPAEIASVELMELEGDSSYKTANVVQNLQRMPSPSKSIQKEAPPIALVTPEQAVPHQRSPTFRFEEYRSSPSTSVPGKLQFSPITEYAPSLHTSVESSVTRPSYKASKDTSLGDTAICEEAYTLFRWPDTMSSSSANSTH